MERSCKSPVCTVACRGNGCVDEEGSYDRLNTTIPRPTATGGMAASIVAANHDTACKQGAQCDCQTVTVFDQNEKQCHISVGFYTNCHRILWYGRIQDMHRETLNLSNIRHSDFTVRRQEICIHVATWWSRGMNIKVLG